MQMNLEFNQYFIAQLWQVNIWKWVDKFNFLNYILF